MGIGIFFVLVILLGVILLLLYPLFTVMHFLIIIIVAIVLFLFAIVGFFSFIWYMSREEPKVGKSKNYSIKQGKNI